MDWGLGHATRIIPIIKYLKDEGHHVILGGGRQSMALLRQEFPDLEWEPLPSSSIIYPEKGNLILALIKQLPLFFANKSREKRKLQQIIKKHNIQLVISDNRYGLYNKNIYSIIITHQIMLKMPISLTGMEKWVHRFHKRLIKKFDRCWIPDYDKRPYLSGDLAHKYPLLPNWRFIGPLSRFSEKTENKSYKPELLSTHFNNDILVLISGPEPARSVFENIIIKQLSQLELKSIIVRGQPITDNVENKGNIRLIDHVKADELKQLIINSKYIIARSGYSTIMDLVSLKRTAILVPTPGQTEQEYLGAYLSGRKMFLTIQQSKLNIWEAINQLSTYTWQINFPENNLLENEISEVVKQLKSID